MTALISLAAAVLIVGGGMVAVYHYGMRDLRNTPDVPDNDR